VRLDAQDIATDNAGDTGHFGDWKVDRRTRYARLAESYLEAFLMEVGSAELLTSSDKLDIEAAALDSARSRVTHELFAKGKAVPSDVAAASHLARKGRAAVGRIAKRTRALRRASR
jgi:hypothetical protein